MCALYRLARDTAATAAVEAAIFLPIFLLFTVGITDLGSGMFLRMQSNAATQSGAMFAVVNSGVAQTCARKTTACLNAIQTAMNSANGNPSFCTGPTCSVAIAACADGTLKADHTPTQCITVTASYPYSPILPATIYSWVQSTTITSTATVRVQ